MRQVKAKVTLLSYTNEPFKTVVRACRLCWSGLSISELFDDERFSLEDDLKLLKRVLASGHHSVLEHASFTFGIEGVSRAMTHQLVRHRIASFSQQSQRYVKIDGELPAIIPPDIGDGCQRYQEAVDLAFKEYRAALNGGVKAEDARFLLPNAAETKIIVTMNVRSLLNFFHERLCSRAQWEIRGVAERMLHLLTGGAPEGTMIAALFEGAGPECFKGKCKQGKASCGNPWRSDRGNFAHSDWVERNYGDAEDGSS